LNHDNLVNDTDSIIEAFVHGCTSKSEEILNECANAISFLITHRLVYKETDPGEENKCVLDALMFLTGSESKFVILNPNLIRSEQEPFQLYPLCPHMLQRAIMC
jgi:hypothetical protein